MFVDTMSDFGLKIMSLLKLLSFRKLNFVFILAVNTHSSLNVHICFEVRGEIKVIFSYICSFL